MGIGLSILIGYGVLSAISIVFVCCACIAAKRADRIMDATEYESQPDLESGAVPQLIWTPVKTVHAVSFQRLLQH